MQLLLLLALLLYGGNQGAANILPEIKPVLENLGGEEMQKALKSAEQLSTVLSAVKSMSAPASAASSVQPRQSETFPLAPVSKIADKDITYSLSKYIAQN